MARPSTGRQSQARDAARSRSGNAGLPVVVVEQGDSDDTGPGAEPGGLAGPLAHRPGENLKSPLWPRKPGSCV